MSATKYFTDTGEFLKLWNKFLTDNKKESEEATLSWLRGEDAEGPWLKAMREKFDGDNKEYHKEKDDRDERIHEAIRNKAVYVNRKLLENGYKELPMPSKPPRKQKRNLSVVFGELDFLKKT